MEFLFCKQRYVFFSFKGVVLKALRFGLTPFFSYSSFVILEDC